MENNVQTKDVSRKEALRKIGYGALTAGTMMFLLNGTARAGDNNWGNWDDINEDNGLGLKSGGGSHNSGSQNCGPSASPDCDCKDDSSMEVSGGSVSYIGGNIVLSGISIYNSGDCSCPSYIPRWEILIEEHDHGWKNLTSISSGSLNAPIPGKQTEAFSTSIGYALTSGHYRVTLIVYQRPSHPGTGEAKWRSSIFV